MTKKSINNILSGEENNFINSNTLNANDSIVSEQYDDFGVFSSMEEGVIQNSYHSDYSLNLKHLDVSSFDSNFQSFSNEICHDEPFKNFDTEELDIQLPSSLDNILNSSVNNEIINFNEYRDKVVKELNNIILDYLSQLKSKKKKISLKIGRSQSSSYKSFKNIARCIFLINCIFRLQKTNCTETKRDIYYQNKLLFETQKNVDIMIDDIACTIGVSRRHLNIIAPNKGMIAGEIYFSILNTWNSENNKIEEIDVNLQSPYGYSIYPNIDAYRKIILGNIKYILIVEKDAIFSRLVRMKYHTKEKCLIVTGKGYPDIGTRLLLSRIFKENSHIPIFCLTDADPFGIDIYLSYKHGSDAMKHQNFELIIPNIQWIGLKPTDYQKFEISSSTLLTMNSSELKKAIEVKKKMIIHNEPGIQEIEAMIESNKKAEIEALCSKGYTFISDVYLPKLINEILDNERNSQSIETYSDQFGSCIQDGEYSSGSLS